MNPNMAQTLVWDHIMESRQQAAAARQAARHASAARRQHPRGPARPLAGAGGMTMTQRTTMTRRTTGQPGSAPGWPGSLGASPRSSPSATTPSAGPSRS